MYIHKYYKYFYIFILFDEYYMNFGNNFLNNVIIFNKQRFLI